MSAASVFARASLLRGPLRHSHPRCVAAPAMVASCVASSSGAGSGAATAAPSGPRFKVADLSFPCFGSADVAGAAKYVMPGGDSEEDVDQVWARLREEAAGDVEREPVLRSYYQSAILSHPCLESALAAHLAAKLGGPDHVPRGALFEVLFDAFLADQEAQQAIRADLSAVSERDPACSSTAHCFLYYKGFLACQAHRAAHRLWKSGRKALALFLQSRVSEVFAVDIHPGARIGKGILLDHATGLVVGETAVIGDNVSILHNVTLGGTGKESGDRHPKIGDGVLVGAGTQILGNVRIGEGAKVGAGSVVLKEVPARTTAVGNPAKLVGGKENPMKLDKMPSLTMDHTSWSDYVI
ncbi:hypothetical protein Taro_027456 [Colocasia esculenta]|uniref:serine O-acetyltransferase n=1 Tax=Colocasia esculenta TaxID=4460 RepID=A0A843VDY7_COLES|nr:hypothetical protein [Colocasia esculenta]